MKLLLALSMFLCSAAQDQDKENTVNDEFDVKPGGTNMVVERKLQRYQCTFTYQAQGGTNEKWNFRLEKLDDQRLQCMVTRGRPSYLFFENFTLSLTGPKVHIEQFEALSSGVTPLTDSETKLDKKNGILSAVQGEFKQKLELVGVIARLGKKVQKEKKKQEL